MRIHHFITELFSRMGCVKLLFFFLLCTFSLCACGQKDGEQFINEDATHTTKVVYEKGVCILKERLLKTDTGYANDGIREEVFDDGTKQVEYYKLGRPDSVLLVYYPSGVLKEKINVYKGNIVGPVHTFLSSGKLESFAWFFAPAIPGKANEPNWAIVFDSTGVFNSKTGRPISSATMREQDEKREIQ